MESNIINIPEGYEIDKENSTERQIVLKEIMLPRTWEDYCIMMKDKKSYFFDSEICSVVTASKFGKHPCIDEFDNEEDAQAFFALSRLRKLRKSWIGDWTPDWADYNQSKFTIMCENNHITTSKNTCVGFPMSFPTEEMRDEFLQCFRDYLEQAKTLI